MTSAGLLLLRLALAVVLAAHGGHMLGLVDGAGAGPGGLTAASGQYASLGLTSPFALAVAVAVLRSAGALLLGGGWFTRWVALLVGVVEGLHLWKNAARWGFFLNWAGDPSRGHGMEFGFLLVGGIACLVLTGAGDWSMDGWRQRSAAGRAAGRARLRDR